MLVYVILMSTLCGNVINLTSNNSSFQYRQDAGIYLLYNKDTNHIYFKNYSLPMNWSNIIFCSALITLILIIIACFYYQQILINFIFNLCLRTQNNANQIDEHVIILHETSISNNASTTYLTVPKSSHHRH